MSAVKGPFKERVKRSSPAAVNCGPSRAAQPHQGPVSLSSVTPHAFTVITSGSFGGDGGGDGTAGANEKYLMYATSK